MDQSYLVVLTLTHTIKSVVTGQAPVTLELRNTPGKNTNSPRWYTHISQLTQFMPPPETYKTEIRSLSTICQVHTGALLLTSGETVYQYNARHPRETTTYTLHVVSISLRIRTTDTSAMRVGLGKLWVVKLLQVVKRTNTPLIR